MNFFEIFENHFKAVLPELFLTTVIIYLLCYGIFYTSSKEYKYPILIRPIAWLSLQTFFISVLLTINNPFDFIVVFNNLLLVDSFTSSVKVIILASAATSILISLDYLDKNKINAFEYIVIKLLAILGMMLMVSAYDLIAMYLAIELQSLSLYVLAAFKRDSEYSTEAGLKYFVLGALSSGFLLFGCAMVYGFTGLTGFDELAKLFSGSPDLFVMHISGAFVGVVFVMIALFFKLAAAPFHMWSPDVYEGAPTTITAFFAIVPKIALLSLLLHLTFYSFYDLIIFWQPAVIAISISSMVFATLGALYQIKIKRLLAYSSIGHIGYLLMGLAAGSIEGTQSLIVYIFIYILMMVNVFSVVLSLRKQDSGQLIKYIAEFANLSRVNPVLAITVVLIFFSMAGVPPLAGFCSKFYVFSAAVNSSLYFLCLVGVFTSVVGAFYYIRIIKIMYFEKIKKHTFLYSVTKENSIVLGLSTFVTVFFFLYPAPLLLLSHKMALVLCA
uniref:NADH dehydrogenase subunit 2 n=1 Tax=Ancoracysta twista TaxID=2044563 RepID=A0A2H4R8H6_9EUKA|nr:NADH dehydrogenase subunit 2 [Ancoracysta twista]ATY40947.1 NADH dehydrogenase subunit 2 [Ancoracysta twista]